MSTFDDVDWAAVPRGEPAYRRPDDVPTGRVTIGGGGGEPPPEVPTWVLFCRQLRSWCIIGSCLLLLLLLVGFPIWMLIDWLKTDKEAENSAQMFAEFSTWGNKVSDYVVEETSQAFAQVDARLDQYFPTMPVEQKAGVMNIVSNMGILGAGVSKLEDDAFKAAAEILSGFLPDFEDDVKRCGLLTSVCDFQRSYIPKSGSLVGNYFRCAVILPSNGMLFQGFLNLQPLVGRRLQTWNQNLYSDATEGSTKGVDVTFKSEDLTFSLIPVVGGYRAQLNCSLSVALIASFTASFGEILPRREFPAPEIPFAIPSLGLAVSVQGFVELIPPEKLEMAVEFEKKWVTSLSGSIEWNKGLHGSREGQTAEVSTKLEVNINSGSPVTFTVRLGVRVQFQVLSIGIAVTFTPQVDADAKLLAQGSISTSLMKAQEGGLEMSSCNAASFLATGSLAYQPGVTGFLADAWQNIKNTSGIIANQIDKVWPGFIDHATKMVQSLLQLLPQPLVSLWNGGTLQIFCYELWKSWKLQQSCHDQLRCDFHGFGPFWSFWSWLTKLFHGPPAFAPACPDAFDGVEKPGTLFPHADQANPRNYIAELGEFCGTANNGDVYTCRSDLQCLSYICHTAASFRGSHPDPVSQLPAHTSEDLVVTEISKVQLAPDPTAHDQYSPVHEFVDDPETFDVHATQSAPSPSSIYPLAQADQMADAANWKAANLLDYTMENGMCSSITGLGLDGKPCAPWLGCYMDSFNGCPTRTATCQAKIVAVGQRCGNARFGQHSYINVGRCRMYSRCVADTTEIPGMLGAGHCYQNMIHRLIDFFDPFNKDLKG